VHSTIAISDFTPREHRSCEARDLIGNRGLRSCYASSSSIRRSACSPSFLTASRFCRYATASGLFPTDSMILPSHFFVSSVPPAIFIPPPVLGDASVFRLHLVPRG